MSKRHAGIDLLRIAAVFLVLILHTLGQGGVLGAVPEGTTAFQSAFVLEAGAYCAVDIFGLTSGYVGYSTGIKPRRYGAYVSLWLTVVFYGLLCAALFAVVQPAALAETPPYLLLFPVTKRLYWYFSAYTGLFILQPLLDAALRALPERDIKPTFVLLFAAFSIWSLLSGDAFVLNAGYSCLWLCVLYLLGGLLRRASLGAALPVPALAAAAALPVLLMWLLRLHGFGALYSYVSPTVLLTALSLLLLFSRLRLPEAPGRAVSFLAKGAFSVYLVNVQRYVWLYFMKGRFAFLGQARALKLIAVTLGFSLVFTAAVLLIDIPRRALFSLLPWERRRGQSNENNKESERSERTCQ